MIQGIVTTETMPSGVRQPEFMLTSKVALVLIQDGTGRLLDMKGSFFALSSTATAMLIDSLCMTQEAAAARLASSYNVTVEQVRGDLRQFIKTLEHKGLVSRHGKNKRGMAIGRYLADAFMRPVVLGIDVFPISMSLKSKIVLLFVYLSMRFFGIHNTIDALNVKDVKRLPFVFNPSDIVAVDEVDAAVQTASALHFLSTECKERALTCWLLLRRQGYPVRLIFGIDLYPFKAHCWCELGDKILTDRDDRCERFTPVLIYG